MRRERRQAGRTRSAELSKLESLQPQKASQPGPFPWDRYAQATRKPSDRELRRLFGEKMTFERKKG
jgi:hypothetical protein